MIPAAPSPAAERLRSAAVFLGLLASVFAVAALGGWATASSTGTWYREIAKPAWTPPSWVFGPAWTFLYVAMATAAWRVWRFRPANDAESTNRKSLLLRWWIQLALNGAWSWAFFWFRNPAAGLLVIGALLGLIASMQPRLARLDRPAALLWTPYVAWVAFATCLNLAIWHLNNT